MHKESDVLTPLSLHMEMGEQKCVVSIFKLLTAQWE